jgi:hypothetical protein
MSEYESTRPPRSVGRLTGVADQVIEIQYELTRLNLTLEAWTNCT